MFDVFESYLRSKISITDSQLASVKSLTKHQHIKKETMLVQINKVSQHTFFVLKGCLRSYVIDEKGKEHIIQFAPENWWIAEQMSVLNQEPAMYFIDAVEDTDCLFLDGSFFSEFEKIVPAARDMTYRLQMNSLRSFQKRLISHLSATGEQRYLSFIKTYPSLALRLPQRMIASYLGVTPESLSRIRKDIALR